MVTESIYMYIYIYIHDIYMVDSSLVCIFFVGLIVDPFPLSLFLNNLSVACYPWKPKENSQIWHLKNKSC